MVFSSRIGRAGVYTSLAVLDLVKCQDLLATTVQVYRTAKMPLLEAW